MPNSRGPQDWRRIPCDVSGTPVLRQGERAPDFGGGGLTNLMHSLARAVDPQADGIAAGPLDPLRLGTPSRQILWLIDGLGYERIASADNAPNLREHLVGELTSVFPSATAPAITTVMTGLPPAVHGVPGWRMRLMQSDVTVAPLPFRPDRSPPDGATPEAMADEAFDQPPLAKRLEWPAGRMHIVTPKALTRGPFTTHHAQAARVHGFGSLAGGIERTRTILADAPRDQACFVYLYWPEFDRICHDDGVASAAARAELGRLDLAFKQLVEMATGLGASVVVTADHGFVDTGESDWIDVDTLPGVNECLAFPMTGEPRVAFAHAKAGMADCLQERLQEALGDRVRCVAPDTLLAAGWFGGTGGGSDRLRQRLGDLALLPLGTGCLHHDGGRQGAPMVGIHGGLLDAEMRIPVVLAGARG